MVSCHADDTRFFSPARMDHTGLVVREASALSFERIFLGNLCLRHDLSAVLARDADTPSLQPALGSYGLLGTNLRVEDAGEDRDALFQTVPCFYDIKNKPRKPISMRG